MRLQKYLAQAGVASRRKSEEYILAGRVKVNGVVVKELGTLVEETDCIVVDGTEVGKEESLEYYMLNKPVGYITSAADEKNRQTVLDLMQDVNVRIFPVGRLDYNTSGLLLLTNDGELTYKLTHPKHHVNKTYIAKVKGKVQDESVNRLRMGIKIEDYTTYPAQVEILRKMQDATLLSITIHEGRNRQVRKMCSGIGHEVINLKRAAMGSLELGELPIGRWRRLTIQEIKYLKGLGE